MKTNLLRARFFFCRALVLSSTACLTGTVSAQQINTTSFAISLVEGTITSETAGGTVLSVKNDLYIDSAIPLDLSQFIINGEPAFSIPALGLSTFGQNNLAMFVGPSDYDFLNASTFTPELLTVSGVLKTSGVIAGDASVALLSVGDIVNEDAFPSVTTDLLSIAPAGAVLTSQTLTLEGQEPYIDLQGTNSTGSQSIEGDVIVTFLTEDIVETLPGQNVPDRTSALPLLGIGLVSLIGFARRPRPLILGRAISTARIVLISRPRSIADFFIWLKKTSTHPL